MGDKPWRVQWHVTPDGRVIQQRSRGEGAHEQLFQQFEPTRPVTVADLDELDRRLAESQRRYAVLAWPFIGLGYAGLAAVVGGIVLGVLTVPPGFALAGIGLAVVVVVLVVNPVLVGRNIARHRRVWEEAGFTSPQGVTIPAREASALVRDPATSSGSVTMKQRT